jgi:hypothetical protein
MDEQQIGLPQHYAWKRNPRVLLAWREVRQVEGAGIADWWKANFDLGVEALEPWWCSCVNRMEYKGE